MKKILLSAAIFSVSFVAIANAQVKDKDFQDWSAYTTDLNGKKVCYALSSPKSQTGNYKKRGEPYLLVTRVSDGVYEISTSSGYKYKENGDVKVDIQGSKFDLFTKGELAWAKDSKQDAQIIDTMKKKGTIEVRGTSSLGSYSIDQYSLKGFTAAFNRVQELCK